MVSPQNLWSGYINNYRIPYEHSEVYSCTSIALSTKCFCTCALWVRQKLSWYSYHLSTAPSHLSVHVYIADYVSLPFGLYWAVASCQDTTSLIARHLTPQGITLLNYIDDLVEVAPSKAEATAYFHKIGAVWVVLAWLKLNTRLSPQLAHQMIWLGLTWFDMVKMTITIIDLNLREINQLVVDWTVKTTATLQQLRRLLGKLFVCGTVLSPCQVLC